ncbi:alpha/beta family hydrolase [Streptomyces sp. NPDC006879]|uniref:alpha/beta hydrolase family protein n=1 Tax=Streptomyces sp. NPDC006879 TaxID=3364767 RepID=UPI0036C3C22B
MTSSASDPEHPATPDRRELVETPAGPARITWYPAPDAHLVLALGHGAGGGIEARDLKALAGALPAHGVSVALVEQPWRVAGKKVAASARVLDMGWRALWPSLTASAVPVVAGGRSAGARVACRTAAEVGAHAVLALGFPLHPPGKPERSRVQELIGVVAEGLPVLVVQGERDPFGRPQEFGPGRFEMTAVPFADHGFAVPKRAAVGQQETLEVITSAVGRWLGALR